MPEALPPALTLPAQSEGRLILDDMARHVPALRFEVPPGARAISVTFDHLPRHPGRGRIPHQLSISVIGPNGPRGTRHNHADQSVRIGGTSASPGYLPGPIEPGIWTVEIDVHRILPPGGVTWRVTAALIDDSDAPACPVPDPSAASREDMGWYRGDLHRHTDHSDAVWTPAEMVAGAIARGFDFAAVTDHNTVSALPAAWAAAGDALVILPGMELTGFHGHALALGSERLHDWRVRDGQMMAERAEQIRASGDLFVIAHPMSAGHPFCTGCFWAHPDVMPGPARLVEVWNGPWGTGVKNPLGLDLFRGWLNAGHRLVATAGSDDHGRYPPDARPGHVLVHAQSLSAASILAGIAAGHVVLTSGPRLTVRGRASDGTRILPGDAADGLAELTLEWSDALPGTSARLVVGRRGTEAVRVVWTAAVGGRGDLALPVSAVDDADWVMAELIGPDGTPEAIANPVFLGDWSRPPPDAT